MTAPFNSRAFHHHAEVAEYCAAKLSNKFWRTRLEDMLFHTSAYRTPDGSTGNSYLRVVRCGDFPRASITVDRQCDGKRFRLKYDGKAFKVEAVS